MSAIGGDGMNYGAAAASSSSAAPSVKFSDTVAVPAGPVNPTARAAGRVMTAAAKVQSTDHRIRFLATQIQTGSKSEGKAALAQTAARVETLASEIETLKAAYAKQGAVVDDRIAHHGKGSKEAKQAIAEHQAIHAEMAAALAEKMALTELMKGKGKAVPGEVQGALKIVTSELEKLKNQSVELSLETGVLPPKPRNSNHLELYTKILQQVADRCANDVNDDGKPVGSITPMSGGSGQVYRLSYEGKPVMALKLDRYQPGGADCPIAPEEQTKNAIPLGPDSLRDAIAAGSRLSNRQAACITISIPAKRHDGVSGEVAERGLAMAWVTGAIGDIEGADIGAGLGATLGRKNQELEARDDLTAEQRGQMMAAFEAKATQEVNDFAARLGLNPDKVYPGAIGDADCQGFWNKVDSHALQEIMLEDVAFSNLDGNAGNIMLTLGEPRGGDETFIPVGIDKGLCCPRTRTPGNVMYQPIWANSPQAKMPVPTDLRQTILETDIDAEHDRARATILKGASREFGQEQIDQWEEALEVNRETITVLKAFAAQDGDFSFAQVRQFLNGGKTLQALYDASVAGLSKSKRKNLSDPKAQAQLHAAFEASAHASVADFLSQDAAAALLTRR